MVVFWGSVSLRFWLHEVKLTRRDFARPLTAEQNLANQRIACQLDSASAWVEVHDGAKLAELLGVETDEARAFVRPTARSQRPLSERIRDELGRALRRGHVIANEPPRASPVSEYRERPPEHEPLPVPRPRAEPEPAPSEPDLPSSLVDQEFQAQTLQVAAEQGAPFCEECAKARRGKDVPSPATHPAPAPPTGGAP